jgi:hypothetical protein
MKTTASRPEGNNVVDLFSGKTWSALQAEQIIRLAPEYDGLSVLYSHKHTDPSKLFTMKIACWALRNNGEVVGMIPWLNRLIPCTDLDDAERGMWEGYYNTTTEDIFFEPPEHKVAELDYAAEYFSQLNKPDTAIVQEIPDTIGTHALLLGSDNETLVLTEVLSWRLTADGYIHAMLIDEEKVKTTPVLTGDPCLYAADTDPQFRYFFQHHIANQIKSEDPSALAAVAMLFDMK